MNNTSKIKLTFLSCLDAGDTEVSIKQGGTATHRVHPENVSFEYLLCNVADKTGKEFQVFFNAEAVPTLEAGTTYKIKAQKALARIPGTEELSLSDHILTDEELKNGIDIEEINLAVLDH